MPARIQAARSIHQSPVGDFGFDFGHVSNVSIYEDSPTALQSDADSGDAIVTRNTNSAGDMVDAAPPSGSLGCVRSWARDTSFGTSSEPAYMPGDSAELLASTQQQNLDILAAFCMLDS